MVISDDKGTESEITAESNVQQTSKKPEVIVLDDTLQDSEIEKSDTDSDVVFVSKQTLAFEVPNKKATGNLPSFIPLELNSSLNHVPASELISRWRKSMENKSQQKVNCLMCIFH